jgi:predicted Zn finger-like uncharacterized protein
MAENLPMPFVQRFISWLRSGLNSGSELQKRQLESERNHATLFSFACSSCGARYSVKREKIGRRGIRIPCGRCGVVITARPDAPAASPSPAPLAKATPDPHFEQCIAWLKHLVSSTQATSLAPHWVFGPPCTIDFVREFERRYSVRLPSDYVRFVTEVGNGTVGGGPFAIFPLGSVSNRDSPGQLVPFQPSTPASLGLPFQHGMAIWAGGDFADDIRSYTEENGVPPQTFDADVLPGALPLADQGCGEWCYLAVSGDVVGTVWEWTGEWMYAVPTPWLRPVSFTEWIVGEVAKQRGLIGEFRSLTGVVP